MLRRTARRTVELAAAIGADPADSTDLRLKKTLLVTVALMVLPVSIIWGAFYWFAGEQIAALWPWMYALISLISLVAFHLTRSFALLRWVQLTFILVAPFLVGVALGGLVASSVVILWSLLAPLAAIAFDSPRRAWPWFLAYAVLLVLTTPLGAAISPEGSTIPEDLGLLFLALNLGLVSFIAFVLVLTFARQSGEAQQRADGLLLNILPPEIAELLKVDSRQIAEQFDDVSVLFADVVDFTPLSARLSASEIVGLLDRLFTDFDALVDRHGVEKIKTIGDAYMVAAGVPRRRPDHAQVLAAMALEMCAVAARHVGDDGEALALRIGIESGPVVAGVIGRRKFTYDLWGDTVNTASRMESHGTPGQVQIGEGAHALLADDFACEPRGMVEVKGKGALRTWYLVGPR